MLLIATTVLAVCGMARAQPSYRSLLESLSHHVAQAARTELDRGNPNVALALALEALPRDVVANDRPYIHEAARVLQTIIRSGGRELHSLRGHDRAVRSAVFSPDGKRALTAGGDGIARVWDVDSGTQRLALRGHRAAIGMAMLSLDGTRILTTSNDGTARLWDAHSGAGLAVLNVGETGTTTGQPVDGVITQSDKSGATERFIFGGRAVDVVCAAAFSADGQRVLTAACKGTVKLWETASGKEVLTLHNTTPIEQAVLSADGARIITRHEGGVVRSWDAASGEGLSILQPSSSSGAAIRFAALSSNGDRLLAATATEAGLWDVGTRAALPTLRLPQGQITAAAISPNGRRALLASSDHMISGWDTTTGRQLFVRRAPAEEIAGLRFSADDERFLAVSADRVVRIWDTAKDSEDMLSLTGHAHDVHTAVFSPDGSRVLSASYDGSARLWAVTGEQAMAMFGNDSRRIAEAKLSPDGRQIVLRGSDEVSVRDVTTGKLLTTFIQPRTAVGPMRFSPDGVHVLTASADRTVAIRNATTGEVLVVLEDQNLFPSGPVPHDVLGVFLHLFVFSPDGAHVWTAPMLTGTGYLWDAASGKLLATVPNSAPFPRPAFSGDGRYLATAGRDGSVRIIAMHDGKTLRELPGQNYQVFGLAFSPDSARLLTLIGGTGQVLDVATGKTLFRLHGVNVRLGTFSPDGRYIVTSAADGASLWDARTGRLVRTFSGHQKAPGRPIFSADGTFVLTTSADRTARLWHIDHSEALAVFRGHTEEIDSGVLSIDGALVVTTGRDGVARLWRTFAKPQELIDHACSLMTRPLSREERRRFFLEEDPKDPPCGWHSDMKDKPPYTPKAAPR